MVHLKKHMERSISFKFSVMEFFGILKNFCSLGACGQCFKVLKTNLDVLLC